MALTGFTTIQNYFEDEPEAEDMRVGYLIIKSLFCVIHPSLQAYIKSIIGALFEQELDRINEWEMGEEEKHFFDE